MNLTRLIAGLLILSGTQACGDSVKPTPFTPTPPSEFPTPPAAPAGIWYSGQIAADLIAQSGGDGCYGPFSQVSSSAWPALEIDGTKAALFWPSLSDGVELDGTLVGGQLNVKTPIDTSTQTCPAGPTTYQFSSSASGTFADQSLDATLVYRIQRTDGTLVLQTTYHLHGRLPEQPSLPLPAIP